MPVSDEHISRMLLASDRLRPDPASTVHEKWSEHLLDPDDPSWEAGAVDRLFDDPWLLSQPRECRARFAIARWREILGAGIAFETQLVHGLLELAQLPSMSNTAAQFAYVEAAEEISHMRMFSQFLYRTRHLADPLLHYDGGLGTKSAAGQLTNVVSEHPAAFLFGVLGGEEPLHRLQLAGMRRESQHPYVAEILRLHVRDESRHVSFAVELLRHLVPSASKREKRYLELTVPAAVSNNALSVLNPSDDLMEHFGVPTAVRRRTSFSAATGDLPAYVPTTVSVARSTGLANEGNRKRWKDLNLV